MCMRTRLNEKPSRTPYASCADLCTPKTKQDDAPEGLQALKMRPQAAEDACRRALRVLALKQIDFFKQYRRASERVNKLVVISTEDLLALSQSAGPCGLISEKLLCYSWEQAQKDSRVCHSLQVHATKCSACHWTEQNM